MKPLRVRVRQTSQALGIPQEVVEKDYALSYILAGVSSHPILKDTLVFKGGTALKKVFFGEYRFSEDLDFSGMDAPKGDELERRIAEAIELSRSLLLEQGLFSLLLERYQERDPHPHGQEAFIIRVQFPWHPGPLCRVKMEISHDEPILLAPEKRPLLHGYYEENLRREVTCYCLEEIIAEKLRTLLQTHEKLITRGWNRPRSRDYYDLWQILTKLGYAFKPEKVVEILYLKNEHRNVSFSSPDDFFSQELVSEAYLNWDNSLSAFVMDLPGFDQVLKELKPLVQTLLGGPYPG